MKTLKKLGKIFLTKKANKKAFTLVELIIVITILAILGNIGFMAFNGYAKDARDANRISTMKNIENGLILHQTKTGFFPKPDDKIDITASGTILSYQGNAGTNVLDIIGFNGGKDPLDEAYYTYATNKTLTKYKILGFIEGNILSNNNIISSTYAINNLSERQIVVKGDELGILLNNITNIPIQREGLGVDIINTKETYKFYFNKNEILVGDSYTLIGGLAGGGLVGYWKFDNFSGTGFVDYSSNNTPSSFSGGVTLTGGVLGKGVYFDGINGEFNVLQILNLGDTQGSPHSISAWLNVDDIDSSCGSLACREWILQLGTRGTGSHHWLIGGIRKSQFGVWNGPQTSPELYSGNWLHVVIVYDGSTLSSYLNGTKGYSNNYNGNNIIMNIKNASLSLAKKQGTAESFYKGGIDELRIYNRALSDNEVKVLYNLKNN